MQYWTRKVAVGLVVLTLVGCESAVLVNTHPERTPAAGDLDIEAQTAAARIAEERKDDLAQPAAATQPADQRVNTSNVRIESQSN